MDLAKVIPFVLALLIACQPASISQSVMTGPPNPGLHHSVSLAELHIAAVDDCLHPLATPDDGLDDTAEIQAALTVTASDGGCVLLRAGVYDFAMPPIQANGRRRYSVLELSGNVLIGQGATTILRFHGDAGGADWHGLGLTGRFTFKDLAIQTDDLTGTSEQTHAAWVRGPADGLIENVFFHHPQRGLPTPLPGGDCIDIVGDAAAPVSLVVLGNYFGACDRSGIQSHGGSNLVTVVNNEFPDTGDLDINSEGSGSQFNWVIARNKFGPSPRAQGATSIALDLMVGATVTDNELSRGIYLYSCQSCRITNNRIVQSAGTSPYATLDIVKDSSDVLIADNTIDRVGPLVGRVIHFGPAGTKTPSNIRVVHNVITQRTPEAVIASEGVVGLTLTDNTITYAGPASSKAIGFLPNGSTVLRSSSLYVTGNTFAGPLKYSVGFSGSYKGIGRVTLSENVGGVFFCDGSGTGGVTGPIIFTGNTTTAQAVAGCALNTGL